MKLALGADHAGFELKRSLHEVLKSQGHDVLNCGVDRADPCDYPDTARRVGEAVAGGQVERGIIVCGSGVGASVAANKIRGVRAGLCHDTFSARQGVEDDDINVLCVGGRIIGPSLAVEVVKAFLGARFSNAERHVRRLNKVLALERENLGPGPT